jgi:hypothetical protein
MFDHVNRFVADPRPEIASTFDQLFGGAGWYGEIIDRMAQSDTREDAIVGTYRERLRKFGRFRHVTSTRIPKPLPDRAYFHLIYGTRHTKGLVEFRDVEKKAIDEQERARDVAKITHSEHRTGQSELFTEPGDQPGPTYSETDRRRRLVAAKMQLQDLLATRRAVDYDHVLGTLLENPMIWRSDINTWLRDMRARDEIEIPTLAGRARIPQFGMNHTIIWKGSTR